MEKVVAVKPLSLGVVLMIKLQKEVRTTVAAVPSWNLAVARLEYNLIVKEL